MMKFLAVIDLFFLTNWLASNSMGAGEMNCGVYGSRRRDGQKQADRNVRLGSWVS